MDRKRHHPCPSAAAATAAVLAGIAISTAAGPAAAQDGEVEELRRDLERMQRQMETMQERLEAKEAEQEAPEAQEPERAIQTDWDFYGSIRAGVGLLDDGDDSDINVFDRGSRIGFRGSLTPNLGSGGFGPEVIWQVESGIDVDEGSGSLASRDTFAGLRDDWGTFRVGFFSTPARSVGRNVDQIFSRAGDNRNLVRTDNLAGGQGGRSPGWDNRVGNSLAYNSPNLGGFSFGAQFSANFDDDFGNVTDTTPAVSTSLAYERGPVWLAFGFETIDRDSNEVPGDDGDPRLFRVGTLIDLGDVTLAGLFQRAENQQGNADWDRNIIGGGASYWVTGTTRLGAQVYHAADMSALNDTGATMAAAEVEHRLYPQTRFYLSVAHTNNDDNAQFQSTRGLISDGPLGENSTSFTLIFRQNF